MSLVLAERPGPLPYRNDLPFRPYVYRGQGVDMLTPELDDEPAGQPAAPAEPCWCGEDMRGYRKHLAKTAGDPLREPCQASREDVNAYHRRRREERALGPAVRKDAARCGTESGYTRHRRNKEPACDECRRASTAASAARRGRTAAS